MVGNYLPVALVTQRVFPSSYTPYNWKLPALFCTTELSSEVIVRLDCLAVYGRKKENRLDTIQQTNFTDRIFNG